MHNLKKHYSDISRLYHCVKSGYLTATQLDHAMLTFTEMYPVNDILNIIYVVQI